ncbi:MAG: hypothetical protein AB7L92_07540 [Alphaproteobacteria bacterium]
MTYLVHVNDGIKDKTRSITPLVKNHKKKKRHKHDYQYWLAEPYNAARGETSLWIAVITQAVMDALSKSRNPEIQFHKREAIYWLTENNKDFIIVCLNAGLDPDYVRQKAKRAIYSPSPWRAEPGKGKRYQERKAYRERIRKECDYTLPHASAEILQCFSMAI